jgi:hypothetical protein
MSATTEQPMSTTGEARPPEPLDDRRTRLGHFLQTPSVGGAIAGAIALGLAASIGVAEAAVAGLVAYGVYAILRKRQTQRAQ